MSFILASSLHSVMKEIVHIACTSVCALCRFLLLRLKLQNSYYLYPLLDELIRFIKLSPFVDADSSLYTQETSRIVSITIFRSITSALLRVTAPINFPFFQTFSYSDYCAVGSPSEASLFYHEDGGSSFLRIVDKHASFCIVLYLKQ
jgi:hypothetical protein